MRLALMLFAASLCACANGVAQTEKSAPRPVPSTPAASARNVPRGEDPYRSFRFRVKLRDRYVAGFTKAIGLEPAKEGVRRLETNKARATQGLTPKHNPITLERGVTHDPEFEKWANEVRTLANSGRAAAQQGLRKDLILDVFNEAGQKAASYKVSRCWVSEYQAVPDLDAGANAVAIAALKLENEGWERLP